MRKTVQNAIRICYSKRQCVSAAPLDPARRLPFPRPPHLCSSKISLKIPCSLEYLRQTVFEQALTSNRTYYTNK